jgi:hypothetical protein
MKTWVEDISELVREGFALLSLSCLAHLAAHISHDLFVLYLYLLNIRIASKRLEGSLSDRQGTDAQILHFLPPLGTKTRIILKPSSRIASFIILEAHHDANKVVVAATLDIVVVIVIEFASNSSVLGLRKENEPLLLLLTSPRRSRSERKVLLVLVLVSAMLAS